MNDRLVLPEQQIECTRQKGIFLNRSIKGGYRIPMLRRMMLGMVYEGQRVITRRKVQVLYPQGLQLQQQCSPQQTNVSVSLAAMYRFSCVVCAILALKRSCNTGACSRRYKGDEQWYNFLHIINNSATQYWYWENAQ